MRKCLSVFAFLGALGLAATAAGAADNAKTSAEEKKRTIVSFANENDFWVIGGSDRYYTNGLFLDLRFNYSPEEDTLLHVAGCLVGMAANCDDHEAGFDSADDPRYGFGFSVGHLIFTPANIVIPLPQPDDRPWAGYLYGGLTFTKDHRAGGHKVYDTVEFQLGVVGEISGASVVQINWHKIIGARRPNGWDNQLPSEPALLARFRRAWPAWKQWDIGNIGTELRLRPYVEGAVGTLAVRGTAGLQARLGHNMGDDVGRGQWRKDDKATWFGFADLNGSAVAHNLFLSGNIFRSSPSVSVRPFVFELRYGLTVQWQQFFLTFSETWQSKEFDGQVRGHRYSTVQLTWVY